MKTLQYIMPCGRVIFVTEKTPRDLGARKKIFSALLAQKEEFEKFHSYRSAGRVRKRWSVETYNKFTGLLIKKLVDHLMESDRIKTKSDHMWMITQTASQHEKHMNWNTNGAVFSTKIMGLKGKYRIVLSRKRGKELTERINRGQKFHVNPE